MSIPSFIASAIAAVLPLTGSTGPVDAQDQLAEPEVTQTADVEQPTDQSDEPGAHAEKGRITGDKEDVINGAAEGSEEVDPGFNGGNPVSYTHLTLPTIAAECRSRWSPYH